MRERYESESHWVMVIHLLERIHKCNSLRGSVSPTMGANILWSSICPLAQFLSKSSHHLVTKTCKSSTFLNLESNYIVFSHLFRWILMEDEGISQPHHLWTVPKIQGRWRVMALHCSLSSMYILRPILITPILTKEISFIRCFENKNSLAS